MTANEIERLEQAIAALEAQRAILGDAVVDVGVAPMKERLDALHRKSGAGRQRRQVTVLFADISGFTLMSETSDAEDITETVNTLWDKLDKVILDYGGVIDKHMGDAVMALWGAQNAREDDAERAVRAGLAMQQAMTEVHLKINNSPIQIRVGIHSGPVFLSEVGITSEYTAMGDTVNTTNRLQHLAPVGDVLISHDTYLLVRGIFDVQPLQPAHIEGKTEPMLVYLVQRAKKRTFRMGTRGLEGVLTRMVGRDADLKCLQDAITSMLQDGKRRIMTIVGEAGIGKSRLLFELENWLELQPERFRYFKGRASPEMQSQPYALIRDLLAGRFGIQESDPVTEVRRKMEQGIAECGWQIASLSSPVESRPDIQNLQSDIEMRAHFIGQLLGYDFSSSPYLQGVQDAQQLRDRALLYLNEFFRANTEARPTLIFLEDIHWADSRSLAVAENLAQILPDQRLFIACLARPALFERYPQWQANQPGHIFLTLNPLSRDDSRQLVAEIMHKAVQVPEALRELVVSGAEGNPYYVEELIKMLIDDGVIVKEDERWHIEPDRLLKVRVPPTLAGILQARLDSLSPMERMILQQASVIGRIFWDSTVAYLSTAVSDTGQPVNAEKLTEILQVLCYRELIFQRKTSAFSGVTEYIFKHALLRDVTYESVSKRDRRGYHARVAEWLIANSGERSGEFIGIAADHMELAGQAEHAARYLVEAGNRASRQFANAEAVQFLSRALDLTPPSFAAERYAILMARERVYDLLGMRTEQTHDLTALKALVESIHDEESACRKASIAARWSNYAEVTGDYPLAITTAQYAVEQARLAGIVAKEAEGILLWGRALWRQGNLSEAMLRNRQALELAQASDLKVIQAQAWRTIGAIAFHQGDYSNVQAPYVQALNLYQEMGDRRGFGSALNNLGDIARQQGDYARAKDYFEQSIRNSQETGERWSETVATCNLGLVSHNLGDQKAACEHATRGIELSIEIGYRSMQAAGYTNLAHALAAMGKPLDAARLYRQAADLHLEIGEITTSMEPRSGLARVFLSQGDLVKARQEVDVILDHIANNTLDGADEPFRVRLTCYQVLRICQDSRASQVLTTSYQLLQRQASLISDESLRCSFLNNVAAHAEIVKEWQNSQV